MVGLWTTFIGSIPDGVSDPGFEYFLPVQAA